MPLAHWRIGDGCSLSRPAPSHRAPPIAGRSVLWAPRASCANERSQAALMIMVLFLQRGACKRPIKRGRFAGCNRLYVVGGGGAFAPRVIERPGVAPLLRALARPYWAIERRLQAALIIIILIFITLIVRIMMMLMLMVTIMLIVIIMISLGMRIICFKLPHPCDKYQHQHQHQHRHRHRPRH